MRKIDLLLSFSLATVSLAFTVPVALAASESDISKDNSTIIVSQNAQIAKTSGIKVEKTQNGIKLFLETSQPNAVKSKTIIEDESIIIIKLNNLQLHLPNNREFLKKNLGAGVNSLSVKQVGEAEVQIKIIGEDKLPNIKRVESNGNLIFNINNSVPVNKIPNNPQSEEIELIAVGKKDSLEDKPANITILDAEQIEKQQARDVRDLVRYEPGVSVPNNTRGGLQGVNIRGLGGNRVQMEVDGIRLPAEFSYGSSQLGRDYVDIETLNALEIFRGNNSGESGSDALGGTVNFKTAEAANLLDTLEKDSFTSVRSGYSSKDKSLFGTITQANRFDDVDTLFIYTRRNGNEFEVGNGNSIYQDDQEKTRNNFLGKVTYNIDEQSFVEFTGEIFNNVTDSKFSTANIPGLAFEFSTTDLEEKVTTNRQRLSLAYQFDKPDSDSWVKFARTHVYFQNVLTEEGNFKKTSSRGRIGSQEEEKDLTDRSFGANIKLRSDFDWGNTNHRLSYGLDISNTYNERNNLRFDTTSGTRVDARGYPQKDFPDSNTFRLGVYLQNEIAFGNSKLKLVPGLRFDSYKLSAENNPEFASKGNDAVDFSESAINPSLGIVYEANPGLTLFSRYSRGFRPPIYDEANFSFRADIPFRPHKGIPNPDIKTETSNNFELGLRSRSQKLDFDVTGFYNRYDNFIQRAALIGYDNNDIGSITPVPFQVFQTKNVSEAEIYGLEIKAAYRFNSQPGGFALRGGLGFQVGNDLTENKPLSTVGPLQAVFGLGYQSPNDKWGAELVSTFVAKAKEQENFVDPRSIIVGQPESSRRIIDPYEPAAYMLVDMIGYYKINPNLTLTAGVYNIFDAEYYQYSDVNTIDTNSRVFEAQRGSYAQPGTNFAVGLNWRF
ncbi:heme transport protein [Calothrix parasitica NIES-267]|uniref:Heme transport protein n=1 Tax=Calothrix parasitica NIES-267 TaxID=1973488 RepID=A0A1Z4LKB7_9CYAN|nr:heme transport protein [Calothrix parasitica NIES-267]